MKTIFVYLTSTKHLFLFLLLIETCCIPIKSFSQSEYASISGIIKDSLEIPLQQATVMIRETNQSGTTREDGSFEIKNILPGKYKIVFQLAGFIPSEKIIELSAGENFHFTSLTLSHDVHQLEDVIINSQKERYKTNEASSSLRLKSTLLEIPQNIQVVTKDILRDQQIISMSDGLVRNVSGLVRAEHWGDMYTNITARGGQVQAFRNGFNVVNSHWGPLTEDMSFVESIEFVKGPAGFMLSSGDPSGLYNVVTKKPTGKTKGEASILLGSFNLYRAAIDLDGRLSENGRLLYRFNVSAQNKNSHRPNEYNNRYVIAPVLSYKLDSKTLLTAEYNYQRADMSNVGSFYVFAPQGYKSYPVDFTSLPAGTPGNKMDDHSIYLNLQHDISSRWKITAQVAHFIYKQVGASMWPTDVFEDGTMIRNIGIWDAKSKMTMGQFFVNGEFFTGPLRHRLLTGIDMGNKNYIADWSQSHDLDTMGAAFNPLNPNLGIPVNGYPQFDRSKSLEERSSSAGSFQDQTYYALYLQDEIAFIENRIRLTIAGRYTDLKQAYYGTESASHFTPRIGLSGTLNKFTSLYALYDQAFIPQAGILSNGKKVQPITGNNLEVGIKKDWSQGRWNTTFAIYRIIKNHELTPDPYQPATSGLKIELGQKRSQGIEFDLKGTIINGLQLIANYAYTDSRVTKVAEGVTIIQKGDVVPGFSKHTINAWLNYKIQTGYLRGIGIAAGSTMLLGRATFWEPAPDPSKELKNYFKTDVGLFWENGNMRISMNILNIFNTYLYSGSFESYFTAPVYSYQTEPGRNFKMSINYNF